MKCKMGKIMARKAAYKKQKQNRAGFFLVSLVLLMMLVVVGIKSIELREKKEYYAQREAELAEQIEAEQQRAEEIAEFETYTQTKKYIEEVARDKLGLVYEGEILFKDEN